MFFHPLHEEKKKTSICGGEIEESDWKSLEEEKRWKDNGKIEMLSDNVSFKIQRIYYFLFISWISWLIEIIIEIKIKNAR